MHIRLEQFEGTLDVLLQLVEREKLDISTISLAKIADQFLAYITERKTISPCELICFLDTASQLLVWKTRLLLPYLVAQLEPVDDEDAENLVMRLQNYKRFLEAAEHLMRLCAKSGAAYCSRDMSRIAKVRLVALPDESKLKRVLSKDIIHGAMLRIVHAMRSSPLPLTTIRRLFNIQDKIREIMGHLQAQKTAKLNDFLPSRFTKAEVIVIFLALLELCKLNFLHVKQQKLFQEVMITINAS